MLYENTDNEIPIKKAKIFGNYMQISESMSMGLSFTIFTADMNVKVFCVRYSIAQYNANQKSHKQTIAYI